MQFLATFLVNVFSGFFTFVTTYFGARAALTATVVAVSAAVTVAAYVCVQSLIGLLTDWGTLSSSVGTWAHAFLMAFWSLWPENAASNIAAVFGVDVCIFLYRYKVHLINAVGRL